MIHINRLDKSIYLSFFFSLLPCFQSLCSTNEMDILANVNRNGRIVERRSHWRWCEFGTERMHEIHNDAENKRKKLKWDSQTINANSFENSIEFMWQMILLLMNTRGVIIKRDIWLPSNFCLIIWVFTWTEWTSFFDRNIIAHNWLWSMFSLFCWPRRESITALFANPCFIHFQFTVSIPSD